MDQYVYNGSGETREVVECVNAALSLKRPLLVIGPPGGLGLSNTAYRIARELDWGRVLTWPIRSTTTVKDGLYTYDVDAHKLDFESQQARDSASESEIGNYIKLGPLGTSFISTSSTPRVLLIEEVDRGSTDFLGDLAVVLSARSFQIPELVRLSYKTHDVAVHTHDRSDRVTIASGTVECQVPPLVVLTSHGEQQLPPRLIRECISLHVNFLSREEWRSIIRSEFSDDAAPEDLVQEVIYIASERHATVKEVFDAIRYAATGNTEDVSRRIRLAIPDISGGYESEGLGGDFNTDIQLSESPRHWEASIREKIGPPRLTASQREQRADPEATYDLFISHASEDKAFARPFYEALIDRGMQVWFDEATLKLGDSLRRKIDEGLAACRYGIVILSPSFLKKEWPQRELDGLVARETADGKKAILPIWHQLGKPELIRHCPILADKLGVSSEIGIDAVVDKVLDAIGHDDA